MASSATRPRRIAACLLGAVAGCILRPHPVRAFPSTDLFNPTGVPTGADLSAPDVQDLRHQMQLLSGFGTAGPGWTILPRLTIEEMLTDNVLQLNAPRRWDASTMVAPGLALASDTTRLQLRLDYEPQLQMYIRTGSQNALTQQLNAVGLVTLVPDRLFVDVRGLTGVQATFGGIGGLGSVGQPGAGAITSGLLQSNNQLGLTKQDRTQTTSFSVSPYMLYHVGEIGSGQLGVSVNESAFSPVSGFAPLPWATGSNGQTTTSIEENASFQTGDVLSRMRNSVLADASQSRTQGQTTLRRVAPGQTGTTSSRYSLTDQIVYVIDPAFSVTGQLGWESISYTGPGGLNETGPVWSLGVIYTPNADTSVSLGYGHQDGVTSFSLDARYALSARTVVTAGYHSGIATQTEQLRNQLNQASVANNGSLVNSRTGGLLFQGNNALGVTPGVYRYSTMTVGATTVLARDSFSLSVAHTTDTQTGSGSTGQASAVWVGGVSWMRQVNPDLGVSATLNYSTGTPVAGFSSTSLVGTVSAQYTLSETVSAFASYSYLQRQSSQAAQSMFEDLLILGLTKQF